MTTSSPRPATSIECVVAADDLVVDVLLPLLANRSISLEIFRALRHMSINEDGLTVGELGRLIACTPPATTRIVDKLVTEGLAYRRVDSFDRRRILVIASEAGANLWAQLAADVEA